MMDTLVIKKNNFKCKNEHFNQTIYLKKDIEEFGDIFEKLRPGVTNLEINKAFFKMDSDSNGKITLDGDDLNSNNFNT